MKRKRILKKILLGLFSALTFFMLINTPAVADSPSVSAAAEAQTDSPDNPAESIPADRDTIGKAGEMVGRKLDGMGERASSYFGDWINAQVFAGITWLKLLFCLIMVLCVGVVERTLQWGLGRKTGPRSGPEAPASWQKVLLSSASKPLSLFIWVYGLYIALSPLFIHFQAQDGSNLFKTVAGTVADMCGVIAIFWLIYRIVALLDVYLLNWARRTESSINDMLMPLIGKTLRILILIMGGIIIIQNTTGIQIGPLLASLGIGGLAVALAAKDSIANFFGTLTILFDKPFQIGERIVIDKYDGVVERVGFRSTRIRLPSGHLVTIPNEKIVNTGLENIGKRPYIRWMTNIGITYDTPPEKVERAVEIIREILDNHEGFHPDFPPRAYFNGFNDWSLNILVIAWYHPPNYWDYQAWLQRTCTSIMKCFQAEGIDFAFPSQTLYLANDGRPFGGEGTNRSGSTVPGGHGASL
jgi:MscS family membrane protein